MSYYREIDLLSLPFDLAFRKWGNYPDFQDSLFEEYISTISGSLNHKTIDFDSIIVSISNSPSIFRFQIKQRSQIAPEITQEEKESNFYVEFNKYIISKLGQISKGNLFYISFYRFTNINEPEDFRAKIAGADCILKESQFDLDCLDAESYEESFQLICMHDNVQKCYGHTFYEGRLLLALEPYDKSLEAYLAISDVSLVNRLKIMIQIAQGLASIHMREVVHNNISPWSVYLKSDDSVIIGDFERAYDSKEYTRKGPKCKEFSTDANCSDPREKDIYSLALLSRYILAGHSCQAVEDYFTQIMSSFPDACPDSGSISNTLMEITYSSRDYIKLDLQ